MSEAPLPDVIISTVLTGNDCNVPGILCEDSLPHGKIVGTIEISHSFRFEEMSPALRTAEPWASGCIKTIIAVPHGRLLSVHNQGVQL